MLGSGFPENRIIVAIVFAPPSESIIWAMLLKMVIIVIDPNTIIFIFPILVELFAFFGNIKFNN